MIEYVRKIAEDVATINNLGKLFTYLRALREELDRLDPRDFLPDAQYDFVYRRMSVREFAKSTSLNTDHTPEINRLGKEVVALLDKYGGQNSQALTRSFTFVKDPQLRTIIERDYKELSLRVFPSGSWKSTVILAGSLLEAILYDLLTCDSTRKVQAMSSSNAPIGPGGRRKNIDNDEWSLHDLIEVSVDLNLLPEQRARTFDQVLRDYRNFVHPRKEVRSQHPCSEAEAFMAKGALDGICNHLSSAP